MTPAPTQRPQPQGPVANLLNRLKEGEAAREEATRAKEPAAEVDESEEAKPEMKSTRARQEPSGHLAAREEATQAKEPAAEVEESEEAKPEVKSTRARQEPSGPLAKMLEKMEEAKAAKQGAEQRGKDGVGPSPGP